MSPRPSERPYDPEQIVLEPVPLGRRVPADSRRRAEHLWQEGVNAERIADNDPEQALLAKEAAGLRESPSRSRRRAEPVAPGVSQRKKTPETGSVLQERYARAERIAFKPEASPGEMQHYLNVVVKLARKSGDLEGLSRDTQLDLQRLYRSAADLKNRRAQENREKYYALLRKVLAITAVDLDEYEQKIAEAGRAGKNLAKAA